LRLGGEILSVDSRQVYRGLDLGSGKDLEEYDTPDGSVPYHLIDIADPREVYTLWRYMADFSAAYRRVRGRGRLPVAVGGTGLYLEAVLRDYRIPSSPPDPGLRSRLMAQPLGKLVARLATLDRKLAGATDLDNKKRVVRALEVALHREDRRACPVQGAPLRLRSLVVGLRWDRSVLRTRIAARLDERLRRGLVDEVRALLARGVSRERLEQLGLEYRHGVRFLAGDTSYQEMRQALLRDIGRLAKRQDTYFRGMERRGVTIHWVEGADPEGAAQKIADLMDRASDGSIPPSKEEEGEA